MPVAEAARATHSSRTMLPDLIEIVPPSRRTDATVVLPGSKSLTNRALILAALANNPVVLRGALWSEDTQAIEKCLPNAGAAAQALRRKCWHSCALPAAVSVSSAKAPAA